MFQENGWVSLESRLSQNTTTQLKLKKKSAAGLGTILLICEKNVIVLAGIAQLGFGPGFESYLAGYSGSDIWVVTPAVSSPYQGVKLGPAWEFRVDTEEDHYAQARTEGGR